MTIKQILRSIDVKERQLAKYRDELLSLLDRVEELYNDSDDALDALNVAKDYIEEAADTISKTV